MLAVALRRSGYRIDLAAGGSAALDRLRERPFDLVLLDLLMPDLDGWSVMEILRRDTGFSPVPVLAHTALELARHEWEDAGFCGYLRKPVHLRVLLGELERCIRRELDLAPGL